MDTSKFYKSPYFKASELDAPVTLTIKDAVSEMIGQGKDAELKLVVYFREDSRGYIPNKTAYRTVKDAWGTDSDDWVGRKIVLYPGEAMFGGEPVPSIKVRMPQPKPATVAKPPPVADVDPADDVDPDDADDPTDFADDARGV